MAKCLYYGDKPIGLIQSNADDVEYSSGVSVKDKIDEIGLVDNVKYLRGMISPTSGSTIKDYIVNALALVVTDNKLTKFDIIIARGGYHSFQGYIYADKNYGAGIYSDTGGDLVMWRRVSNTDYYYNISKTQF